MSLDMNLGAWKFFMSMPTVGMLQIFQLQNQEIQCTCFSSSTLITVSNDGNYLKRWLKLTIVDLVSCSLVMPTTHLYETGNIFYEWKHLTIDSGATSLYNNFYASSFPFKLPIRWVQYSLLVIKTERKDFTTKYNMFHCCTNSIKFSRNICVLFLCFFKVWKNWSCISITNDAYSSGLLLCLFTLKSWRYCTWGSFFVL